MQAKNTCPAMAVIEEIKSGGFADESRGVKIRTYHNLIKGGSSATDQISNLDAPLTQEVVCDNIKFYIARRKLEIARFELSDRSLNCEMRAQKYHAMFGEIAGATRWDVYRAIIDREIGRVTVYQHLCNLLDIIGSIEGMIMQKVALIARKADQNTSISVTLPDLVLPPSVDLHSLYNPAILAKCVELLRGYVMNLNISSITLPRSGSPTIEKIAPIILPPPSPPADFWDTKMPAAPAKPTIDDLKSALAAEMAIAAIACTTEQYHITAVEKMNEIFAVIESIKWN